MGFFFCSPPRPDQLWCSPSLLSNGYRGLFPRGKSGRGPKLTTHLHPVPKLRMRGAIPPLSNTSSWCGSQLKKHRDNFTFFAFYNINHPKFGMSTWVRFLSVHVIYTFMMILNLFKSLFQGLSCSIV